MDVSNSKFFAEISRSVLYSSFREEETPCGASQGVIRGRNELKRGGTSLENRLKTHGNQEARPIWASFKAFKGPFEA